MNPIVQQFLTLIQAEAKAAGRDLAVGAQQLAVYAEARVRHLQTLADDPNFMDAVAVERDNIALQAGIAAVDRSDAIDIRILGIIQGALTIMVAAI